MEPAYELIQASRFLEAAGIVTLLYDHLLTLGDEIEYIWKAKWTTPKVLFLFIRYIVPCSIVLHTYQSSGIPGAFSLSESFCKRWFNIAVLLCLITTGPGNFLMMLWSWLLWERNRPLMFGTLSFFIVTQMITIAFTILIIIRVTPLVIFNDKTQLCALEKRGLFPMIFLPGLVYETIAVATVCWGALDRPRASHVNPIKAFYEDEVMYIAIIFMIQAAYQFMSLFAPVSIIFLDISFMWSIMTMTITRLIIKLRKDAFEKRACGDPAMTQS